MVSVTFPKAGVVPNHQHCMCMVAIFTTSADAAHLGSQIQAQALTRHLAAALASSPLTTRQVSNLVACS